ncbi:MAG: hypothetical protein M5U26_15730 [Planctomycetota bacterium]|nr:hypothetical protein [Planctomycetota bacterium]
MQPLVWSILLTFVMIVCVAMELLTPSFGLLTLFGLGAMVASIVVAFQDSAAAGFAMTGVNLTLFPIAVLIVMQAIKKSPLLHQGDIQAAGDDDDEQPARKPPPAQLGETGEALTDLRPSGAVRFADRRVEVVTEGKWIERGSRVQVIRVHGNVVTVEPADGA